MFVGTWRAIVGEAALGATCIGAGLVLILAATIDRFELLKGLGIEARTRALDSKIQEADKLLAKIKDVASLACGGWIEASSSAGRFGVAPTAEEAYVLSRKVKAALESVGASEDEIGDVLRPWARTIAFDLTRTLVAPVVHELQQQIARRQEEIMSRGARGEVEGRVQTLRAEMEELAALSRQYHRDLNKWQLDEFVTRLTSVHLLIPGLDSEQRESLRAPIAPWLPRLEWLQTRFDLLDKELWFEKLKRSD